MQIDPDLTRVKASVENVILRSPRHHPRNDRRNHMRIMLPGTTLQSVRPLEPVSPEDLQFPFIRVLRSGDQHAPVSRSIRKHMLDNGDYIPLLLRVTRVLHLHDYRHMQKSTPSGWLAADQAIEAAKECHCVRKSPFCCKVHHDHQTGFKTSVFLI